MASSAIAALLAKRRLAANHAQDGEATSEVQGVADFAGLRSESAHPSDSGDVINLELYDSAEQLCQAPCPPPTYHRQTRYP